jgi:hypothetical protein
MQCTRKRIVSEEKKECGSVRSDVGLDSGGANRLEEEGSGCAVPVSCDTWSLERDLLV